MKLVNLVSVVLLLCGGAVFLVAWLVLRYFL